jgi:DNA transformation protein and related proteins
LTRQRRAAAKPFARFERHACAPIIASMSASKEFVSHVRDLLSPIGGFTDGIFFGGHALKHDDKQFAMIMGDTLYFRVSDQSRAAYEAKGSKPFSYATKVRRVEVRTYFAVPEDVLDSRYELVVWARKAIHAATAAQLKS